MDESLPVPHPAIGQKTGCFRALAIAPSSQDGSTRQLFEPRTQTDPLPADRVEQLPPNASRLLRIRFQSHPPREQSLPMGLIVHW
jgi:hypothetical protein